MLIVRKWTFGSGPARDLAGQVDADCLRAFNFPWQVGNDVDSVSASNTDSDHAEATSIRRMRISTDHQTTGESLSFGSDDVDMTVNKAHIVLEDDLMNDTASWLPETD